MSGREKGVASQPCPRCETDLNVVTLPDGGVTTEGCSKCFPAARTERASAQSPTTRERGTHRTENEESQ